MSAHYKIFATSNARDLGEAIASGLGVELGAYTASRFSDGELMCQFDESIRGETVLLIARGNMPYENLFEISLAIDAANRASAKEVICVIPYLPHSRQERKDHNRAPIAARVVADFLEGAGADRIITLDLHNTAIEGFYKIPVDNLDPSALFLPMIREKMSSEDLCLCSPDFGGLTRIRKYKKVLESSMAVIHKERLSPNQVAHMEVIGDVSGKSVVLIDDMVDTAGTLCKAAQLLMDEGAASVSAFATHGLLSGNAIERLENSPISKLYITDTIQQKGKSAKIEVLSCTGLLNKAIDRLVENKSLKAISAI